MAQFDKDDDALALHNYLFRYTHLANSANTLIGLGEVLAVLEEIGTGEPGEIEISVTLDFTFRQNGEAILASMELSSDGLVFSETRTSHSGFGSDHYSVDHGRFRVRRPPPLEHIAEWTTLVDELADCKGAYLTARRDHV